MRTQLVCSFKCKIQYLKPYTPVIPHLQNILVICWSVIFCHRIHSNWGKCLRREGEGQKYCFSIMMTILCTCKQKELIFLIILTDYSVVTFPAVLREECRFSFKKHSCNSCQWREFGLSSRKMESTGEICIAWRGAFIFKKGVETLISAWRIIPCSLNQSAAFILKTIAHTHIQYTHPSMLTHTQHLPSDKPGPGQGGCMEKPCRGNKCQLKYFPNTFPHSFF